MSIENILEACENEFQKNEHVLYVFDKKLTDLEINLCEKQNFKLSVVNVDGKLVNAISKQVEG